jgi:hypothetical protein
MKFPSRPGSGPPHLRQIISRSFAGSASTLMTRYSALQFGHLKVWSVMGAKLERKEPRQAIVPPRLKLHLGGRPGGDPTSVSLACLQ